MKRLILLTAAVIAFTAGLAQAEMSQSQRMRVWDFYTKAEDLYGMDKAERVTAKKFGISTSKVVKIKVEGGMNNWPLPGEEREPVRHRTEAQRQKENQEFGAAMHKEAEKIRQRGY